MNLKLRLKTSDFRDKVTVVLRDYDNEGVNDDGMPVDFTETRIDVRAVVKWQYNRESFSTEKENNKQVTDFYIRRRNALKSLNFEDKILFDSKLFNIEYVNKYDDIFEIRGVYYDTTIGTVD